MDLNYDNLKACTVLMPITDRVNIALIGCGGTGSWLAPHLARIAKTLIDIHGHEVNLVFWDPDFVEKKNIFRQNFCDAEVGLNKASCLASRFSYAWGINIIAMEQRISDYPFGAAATYNTRSIIITCVDNNEARKRIHDYCSNNDYVWWMDTGYLKTAGQIAVGKRKAKNDLAHIGNVTTWLPLPSLQFPGILKKEKIPKVKIDYNKMSCAEMLMMDEQGLTINNLIASRAADMLVSLLILGDLRFHCVFESKESMQVVWNTPEILEKYTEKIK